MLSPDQQMVIDWLYEYGTLKRSQLVRLLSHKVPKTAYRSIQNMLNHGLIFSPSREIDFVGLDNDAVCDIKVITAIWVLLKFGVEPQNHYHAPYPAQIYFVKGNSSYEICVIKSGEESLSKLLRPKLDHKFIIVIEDVELIKTLILPDNSSCLFALYKESSPEPEISFVRGV